MPEALLAVMAVAAAAYVILAGADFGAGMVEPVLARGGEAERVEAAIAPVWEANHVWLVLVAVLAFVGFPRLYVELTTYLHVPLLLILLGIVARGSAFTFRHYDPSHSRMRAGYSLVFRVSSALTPLFLGIVVAASVEGRIGGCGARTQDFATCYLAPWNTPFTWSTGLFVSLLFAFEGTALLAAEQPAPDPRAASHPLPYLRLARRLHLSVIASGALVFVTGWASDGPWFADLQSSPVGLAAIGIATALVPVVALAFRRARPQLLRLTMGAQTLSILCGFFVPSYPILVRMADGDHVAMPTAAAPPAVLMQLSIAVAVGLTLILPALVFLIRVYKRAPSPEYSEDRRG